MCLMIILFHQSGNLSRKKNDRTEEMKLPSRAARNVMITMGSDTTWEMRAGVLK